MMQSGSVVSSWLPNGEARIVAEGPKGKITVTVMVDEEGYPVVDVNFGGKGHMFYTNPQLDPCGEQDVPEGNQLTVTLKSPTE